MWGGQCWICSVADATEEDHGKSLSAGGWHCLANLRPACKPCNASKQDDWPLPRADRRATSGTPHRAPAATPNSAPRTRPASSTPANTAAHPASSELRRDQGYPRLDEPGVGGQTGGDLLARRRDPL